MTKQQFVNRLKIGAAPVVLGLALASTPAFAQTSDTSTDQAGTPAASATPATTPQDVVVTGTRIQSPNVQSTSPITTVMLVLRKTLNSLADILRV